MWYYLDWESLMEAIVWISGHGWLRGRRGGRGHGGKCGGNFGVKFLVPVGGAAVAEGPDALPALCDVEGAPGAGVRHWDVSEAILAAAALQLLLIIILWKQKNAHFWPVNKMMVCKV